MKLHFLILFCIVLTLSACKRTADTTDTGSKQNADSITQDQGIVDPVDEAGYLPAQDPEWKTIIVDRFHFALDIPAAWKALDKSNNGDGYFIESGDVETDIRVYGENISANPVMAEAELAACDRTEDFHFANGYPGIHCVQGNDDYYYYDTPSLRMIIYIHADPKWKQQHADMILNMTKSLRAVQEEAK